MSEPNSQATERYLTGDSEAASKIADLLKLKQVTSIEFSIRTGGFATLTATMLVPEQEGLEAFEYITKHFSLVEALPDETEHHDAVGPL